MLGFVKFKFIFEILRRDRCIASLPPTPAAMAV
jgi:hypothetical protein